MLTLRPCEPTPVLQPTNGCLASKSPEALRAILDSSVNVVVWRRLLRPATARALGRWVLQDEFAIDGDVDADHAGVNAALSALPDHAPQAFMRDDVGRLVELFAHLCEVRRVRLVLAIRRDDACRKFHTDNVRLRLVTTYVGPGTEWIPNDGVNRAVLAQPPECPSEANRSIATHPALIRRARPGDVLLLKGDREVGTLGAVHRSPPIERHGLARLVLALTAISG